MSLSRRHFLQQAVATSVAFTGLAACQTARGATALPLDNLKQPYLNMIDPHGPLRRDLAGLFDLPDGFSYRVLSTMGEEMSDGLLAAGDFDGMGCFARPDGLITLVRNHELRQDEYAKSAFGPDASRLDRIDRSRVWDWTEDGRPHLGGAPAISSSIRTLWRLSAAICPWLAPIITAPAASPPGAAGSHVRRLK
ncbi:alkaline phosphatase PhoX [Maricaulis sp.]|uniref:alkaline phosphatase PhoX n=1 Tax=Maricaulis sp. TaxID=1486257 RepID=UPI0025BB2B6B|nr:alkaline phosphatase PhoX [Maricaulis sp.]